MATNTGSSNPQDPMGTDPSRGTIDSDPTRSRATNFNTPDPDTVGTTTGRGTWNYREDVASTLHTDGSDVVGFDVEAVDGGIGKIDAASQEADRAHLVVDTGWWIFGKKRLIPAAAVQSVSYDDEKVFLSLTKDEVKNAPDFDWDRDTATDAYFGEADRPAHDDYYAGRGW